MKFKKSSTKIQALIDFDGEVNAITPVYAAVFGLYVCPTNVKAQNIDESTLPMHNMVLANF